MTAFHRDRVHTAFKLEDNSPWQSLLNFCYEDWNKPENGKWDLEDMINNARFTYGEVVELACLLGKYNQQITNGGHSQYFDNGYSGSHPKRGREYDYDVPLTQRMLELMDKFKLSDTDYGKKVHDIVQDFIVRTTNYTPGESDYDDEQDALQPDYEDLDDSYYAVDEWWAHELERYFGLWIEFGEDPIATGRF